MRKSASLSLGYCYLPPFFSLLAYINILSMESLIFLMIGLILFIIQGGFFDAIVYSFHRFSRTLKKKKQLIDVDDETPLEALKKRDGSRWAVTWPLIILNLLFFILSLGLSGLL
ncbi:DUF3899 domain-containing protein [Terrilactibacillus sp. S3-3]|nr:DUF3899 domain-containing protein [Terrilactibacillus sp. S3-3]